MGKRRIMWKTISVGELTVISRIIWVVIVGFITKIIDIMAGTSVMAVIILTSLLRGITEIIRKM